MQPYRRKNLLNKQNNIKLLIMLQSCRGRRRAALRKRRTKSRNRSRSAGVWRRRPWACQAGTRRPARARWTTSVPRPRGSNAATEPPSPPSSWRSWRKPSPGHITLTSLLGTYRKYFMYLIFSSFYYLPMA